MAGFGGTKEAAVIWFDRGDLAAARHLLLVLSLHEKVSLENAFLLGS